MVRFSSPPVSLAAPTADSTATANVMDVVGHKSDAAVTTVGTTKSLMAYLKGVLGLVDTEVAAIKAKTDNLPASPANEATLTTIASYIDTEVAAIKAATDRAAVVTGAFALLDEPTQNTPITLTGGAGAGVDGAYTQIEASASGIYPCGLLVYNSDAALIQGRIIVAYGAAASESLIAIVPVILGPGMCSYIPWPRPYNGSASTRYSAYLSTVAGGSQTVKVKLVCST